MTLESARAVWKQRETDGGTRDTSVRECITTSGEKQLAKDAPGVSNSVNGEALVLA